MHTSILDVSITWGPYAEKYLPHSYKSLPNCDSSEVEIYSIEVDIYCNCNYGYKSFFMRDLINWLHANAMTVADLHTKVSGVRPPPNRTKFFRFYICFHQKVPVLEVGTPSNEGWRPPMGNLGSAPE